MTQAELITLLANATGSTEGEAEKHLHAFRDAVHQEVQDGNDIRVPGLGTFHVVHVAERQGRNPQTQAPMTIAAHKSARFKPAEALKRAAQGKD